MSDDKTSGTQEPEEEEISVQIEKSIKSLDIELKIKAIALNHHLEKKKELDEELEKEIKALTVKYEKLSGPLYSKQQEIITGQRAPMGEELENAATYLTEEEKSQMQEKSTVKAIEGYWGKAMKNCDMIGPEIKEKDEIVLEALQSITYQYLEGTENFEIKMNFAENEYFSNASLKKTFIMKEEEEPLRGDGTEIEWKEGKNITRKQVKKTQKNKKSGAKRTINKEVEDESFFNFFKTVAIDEEAVEDDEFALEEQLNIQYDIARTLIDEVVPYSLEYFLGVKNSDVQPMDGEEQFDDQEDEEPEEESPKKKSKKNKKKASH